MKNRRLILMTLILTALIAAPSTLLATDTYTLLAPLQGPKTGISQTTDLASYIKGMFQIAMGLASVLAIFMIVYGGILYMSTDAYFQKTEGKTIIKQALWGLAILMASYLILMTINPKLLDIDSMLSAGMPKNNTPTQTAPQPCPPGQIRPTTVGVYIKEVIYSQNCPARPTFTLFNGTLEECMAANPGTPAKWCDEVTPESVRFLACYKFDTYARGRLYGWDIYETDKEMCASADTNGETDMKCEQLRQDDIATYNNPSKSTNEIHLVKTGCYPKS